MLILTLRGNKKLEKLSTLEISELDEKSGPVQHTIHRLLRLKDLGFQTTEKLAKKKSVLTHFILRVRV